MKIHEILTEEHIGFLAAETKAAALAELAELAASGDNSLDAATLRQALEHRETLLSTGIGRGIAIPHVRMAGLDHLTMALGVSRGGIADYDAMDGKPVHILVTIAAPTGQHEAYLKLVAQVMERLRDAEVCRRIVEAADAAEVLGLVTS